MINHWIATETTLYVVRTLQLVQINSNKFEITGVEQSHRVRSPVKRVKILFQMVTLN